jgi:hypothetical protein
MTQATTQPSEPPPFTAPAGGSPLRFIAQVARGHYRYWLLCLTAGHLVQASSGSEVPSQRIRAAPARTGAQG